MMDAPQQMRYQWPDGTWIRWNPQTQSWEKEDPALSAALEAQSPAPAETPTIAAALPPDQAEIEPALEDTAVVPPDVEPEEAPAARDGERKPRRADYPPGRSRRPMVGDVLPPIEEAERPGGSLWPTIFTGMVVGLGVGLAVWNFIR